MSHARVFVAPWNAKLKTVGSVRAETDADGRFEFDAPDMTYTDSDGHPARRQGLLMATADGFGSVWMRTWGNDLSGLRAHSDPVKGAALNLRLAKDDVPIHGRFLNHDGSPLAGARVQIIGLMSPLEHDLDAHLAREVKFTELNVTDYEYEISKPDLLPGLVVETKTDAEGRFKLSGIGRDRLAQLKVSAPSVVDTELVVMARDAPDVRTRLSGPELPVESRPVIHGAGFTLQLKPGRTVTGRVIDRDTRQPIAGMWVGPRQNALNDVTSSLYPWVTDNAGRFTIYGLSPLVPQVEIAAVAPPGWLYQSAGVTADGDAEILIETSRGIPFRLKLVDAKNRPVDAEVSYSDIQPNLHLAKVRNEYHWPVSRAAKKVDGTYEGFVLPGPGAVLVKMPQGSKHLPARVDPKAFFAPGRTNWTKEEQVSEYGTLDELVVSLGVYRGTVYRGDRIHQSDYAAIVLVNPPKDSGTLDLSAVVANNPPLSRRQSDRERTDAEIVTREQAETLSRPIRLEGDRDGAGLGQSIPASFAIPPQDAVPNRPQDKATLGTLSGRFVYDGEPPAMKDLYSSFAEIDVSQPQQPGSDGRFSGVEAVYRDFLKHKIRPKTEDASLLVSKDGGIANVVVWVVSKDIPWTAPPGEILPATIRLQDGNFSPRFAPLTVGQPLLIENNDLVSLNFAAGFSRALNPSVNLLLRPGTENTPQRVTFRAAEPYPARYRSNLAPWANGHVFVHANPFVAVSQPNGSFTLPNLPTGDWEFQVWHERGGFLQNWPKGRFQQSIKLGDNSLGTIKLKPEHFGQKPAQARATTPPKNREQIGEVLGKPIYRDEVKDDTLHGIFLGPVWTKYQEAHRAAITPTDDEIKFAADVFDQEHRQRIEKEGRRLAGWAKNPSALFPYRFAG